MEFGIEKCNTLILKRGIKDENCDIMLSNNLKISSIKEGENYRYLGILETEDINTKKIKAKTNTLGTPGKLLSQNSIVEISSKL